MGWLGVPRSGLDNSVDSTAMGEMAASPIAAEFISSTKCIHFVGVASCDRHSLWQRDLAFVHQVGKQVSDLMLCEILQEPVRHQRSGG